jgi:hypothetical protein
MTHPLDIPLVDFLDDFGFSDDADIRDLIHTTPLPYDADGLPVGYDADHLFGLDGAYSARRSL